MPISMMCGTGGLSNQSALHCVHALLQLLGRSAVGDVHEGVRRARLVGYGLAQRIVLLVGRDAKGLAKHLVPLPHWRGLELLPHEHEVWEVVRTSVPSGALSSVGTTAGIMSVERL